jgi:hypothetical protein
VTDQALLHSKLWPYTHNFLIKSFVSLTYYYDFQLFYVAYSIKLYTGEKWVKGRSKNTQSVVSPGKAVCC